LPGLSEELAFRGLVQNAPGRTDVKIALSAILFALFHVDPHHVVGVLPLGVFLAWVGARYGVLVTIGAHVLNNSVAIAMVKAGHTSDEVAPLSFLMVSWVVVIACVIALARLRSAGARPAHTTVSTDAVAPPLEP
jgi:membrane protease YdiL (CAAX protease family)